LCSLNIKATRAAADKNWAELGAESSSQTKPKYLRVFWKKIALAAGREQAN